MTARSAGAKRPTAAPRIWRPFARQYNELLVGRDAGAITEINELLRRPRL